MNPSTPNYAPNGKPYTLKALSEAYQKSRHVMRTELKGIVNKTGPRIGNYYTPRQVNIIFESLGLPPSLASSLPGQPEK